MMPFERYYRIGQKFKNRPDIHTKVNPVFTTEENKVLQNALNNFSNLLGRRATDAEVKIFVMGWTSGISFLGSSGVKIIFVEKSLD